MNDYCSYKLSDTLNKLNFPYFSNVVYYNADKSLNSYQTAQIDEWEENEYIPAISLWDAAKWLRIFHHIDINIDIDDETDTPYTIEIYKNKKCVIGHWENGFFAAYEKALEMAIELSLNYIKESKFKVGQLVRSKRSNIIYEIIDNTDIYNYRFKGTKCSLPEYALEEVKS